MLLQVTQSESLYKPLEGFQKSLRPFARYTVSALHQRETVAQQSFVFALFVCETNESIKVQKCKRDFAKTGKNADCKSTSNARGEPTEREGVLHQLGKCRSKRRQSAELARMLPTRREVPTSEQRRGRAYSQRSAQVWARAHRGVALRRHLQRHGVPVLKGEQHQRNAPFA